MIRDRRTRKTRKITRAKNHTRRKRRLRKQCRKHLLGHLYVSTSSCRPSLGHINYFPWLTQTLLVCLHFLLILKNVSLSLAERQALQRAQQLKFLKEQGLINPVPPAGAAVKTPGTPSVSEAGSPIVSNPFARRDL
jgi:hypothetical protein